MASQWLRKAWSAICESILWASDAEGLAPAGPVEPWALVGWLGGDGVGAGGSGSVDGATGGERGGVVERGGWRDGVLEVAVCRLGPGLDALRRYFQVGGAAGDGGVAARAGAGGGA